MGFPSGVQTVVLTGRMGSADGAADRDTITITPAPERIVSGQYDFIVERKPITVTPNRSSGSWAVRLLATDAASINPSGWTYQVQIGDSAPFFISLPTSLGATADLSDLVTVAENPGQYDLLVPTSELGTAAFLDVGETAGTVAAGNDARFAANGGGALLASNDLSDLHNAPTARTNLGLGTAAVQPASAFDASGAAAAALVSAKSYADTGDAATLVSAKAYTDAHAGGGGSAGVSSDGRINEEIVVLAAAADWTIVTTSLGVEIGVTVAASVGDRIWFSPSFLRTGGVVFLDMGIKAAAGGVSRYISSGESTPREQGYAPLYPLVSFTGVVGIREFIVQAGEVDGNGNVKIVLAYKGPADGNQSLYFGGGYDGAIWTNNPDA